MTIRWWLPALSLLFASAAPALAANPRETLRDEIEVLGSEEEVVRWKGEIELGATYSSGNTDRRGFNAGARAARETVEDLFESRFTAVYSEEDGERSTNEQVLSFRYDRKELPWYWFGFLSFERDEFEDLDLRIVFSPGVGYVITDTPEAKAKVEIGPSGLYQDYEDTDGDWEFELRIGFRGEWAVFEKARITEDLQVFPSLSDSGEYRVKSETAFEQPLSDVLFFKLAVLFDYNTDVPEGVDRQDLKVLASLVYKF